jgi:hypothetical protein
VDCNSELVEIVSNALTDGTAEIVGLKVGSVEG